MTSFMHYFAIFATLLLVTTNPLSASHQGRMRSHSVIGHTSEICEPVYKQHRYREYTNEDDDIRDYRHRNRENQVDDTYDYTDDHSDELLRELALEKALSMFKKSGRSKTRIRNDVKKNWDAKKLAKGQSARLIGTANDRNYNTNINGIVHEYIAVDNNADSNDDREYKSGAQPAARIFENEKVTKRISHSGKYDPPPYAEKRFDRLSSRARTVNSNTNINNIVFGNNKRPYKKDISSESNNDQPDTDSEKNLSEPSRDKAHGKKNKKKKTHHNKQHHQQSQTSSSQENHDLQEENLTENSIESTTSIVETNASTKSSLTDDSATMGENQAESTPDLTETIIKSLIVDDGDPSFPRKVRKLKSRLDRMSDNEKEALLNEIEGKNTINDINAKVDDKARDDQATQDGDGTKVIVDDTSESPDKTENGAAVEGNEKIRKDVKENSSTAPSIDDGMVENEVPLNNDEIDENEFSNSQKPPGKKSIVHYSKLKEIPEDPPTKEEASKDPTIHNDDDTETNKEDAASEKNESSTTLSKEYGEKILEKHKTLPKLHPVDEDDSDDDNLNHNGTSARPKKVNSSENSQVLDTDGKDNDREIEKKRPPHVHIEIQHSRRNNGRFGDRPKVLRPNGNSYVNRNDKNPDRTASKGNKGSANHSSPRRKHRNKNENINSNVNNVQQAPVNTDYENDVGKISNRRTLDPSILNYANSNRNSNVNTNGNVNRNVKGAVDDGIESRFRHRGRRPRPSHKTVKNHVHGLDNLHLVIGATEQDPYDQGNLDYRRQLLHKRHNDMAYLDEYN